MIRRWKLPALEAFVAFATPALFLATATTIRVNALSPLGRVSGLAGLELRFFLFAIALVVALIIAARVREGRAFPITTRLVCAAAAGLATGLVAGGVLVALRGTPWGLHTTGGDVMALADWATKISNGESAPPLYPPIPVHVLATYSDLVGRPPMLAVKHLQIAGTLAFGPVAYLCWRSLLKPGWALGIAVVSILPLVEPYKPYPNLVLVAFVPLVLLWLRHIRDVETRTWGELVKSGIAFGATFGLLLLSYSGWFKWAAPGLFVAMLVVIPWRTARNAALSFIGITGVVFFLIAGRYIASVLFDPEAAMVDKFIYFDVFTEPMYFAMWLNDLQGTTTLWPPLGELGGVGLFTLILCVGFGVAVAYGRNRVTVIGLVLMMVGAWLFRFWYARLLWETKLVQLYPRTSALILYCLLALTGLAVFWVIRRRPTDSPVRGHSAQIGAVCALLLVFASAGSAISNRYMPEKPKGVSPPTPGFLSWTAQQAARTKVAKPRALEWIRQPSLPGPALAPIP